jgi:hypothetical protein
MGKAFRCPAFSLVRDCCLAKICCGSRDIKVRRTMDNVMELVFWVGLLPGLTEELSELNGAQHEKTSADQQS